MSESKTLTQIRATDRLIDSLLQSTDGEVTPEIEAMMSENALAEPEKVQGYYYLIQRLKAEIAYLKQLEAEPRATRKTLEAKLDWLNENLKRHAIESGKKELIGIDHRYAVQKAKPVVAIIDEKLIPGEYKDIVTSVEIAKDRIKEDLEAGVEVAGAKLVQAKYLKPYTMAAKKIESKKKKDGAA